MSTTAVGHPPSTYQTEFNTLRTQSAQYLIAQASSSPDQVFQNTINVLEQATALQAAGYSSKGLPTTVPVVLPDSNTGLWSLGSPKLNPSLDYKGQNVNTLA